jgi:hypothetical protein
MDLLTQVVQLLILAVPVAWMAWTFTKEEVFRELREFFVSHSRHGRTLAGRKLAYLFTCEYCFSHWVALGFQFLFQFKLVFNDWRGNLVAFAALVWTANVYMSLYLMVRVDIRKDRAEADQTEKKAAPRRAA